MFPLKESPNLYFTLEAPLKGIRGHVQDRLQWDVDTMPALSRSLGIRNYLVDGPRLQQCC